MGLFGYKSREERQREERVQELIALQDAKKREQDAREQKIQQVAAWGFDRELQHVGLDYLNTYVEPFKKGSLAIGQLISFLRVVTTERGNPTIAKTHPQFPLLIFRILEAGNLDIANNRNGWKFAQVGPVYEYSYPAHFRLLKRRVSDACADTSRDWAVSVLLAIALLDDTSKEKARRIIFEGANYDCPFDLLFVICVEHGWINELEAWLRVNGEFEDVLKVLLYQKNGSAVLEWLKEHHKYADSVKVLEHLGRFGEAAQLLRKLGSEGSRLPQEILQREYVRLQRLAAISDPSASAETAAREIEENYTYGVISKDEYERLKAKAAPAPAKSCGTCGKPVNPEFAFCPHCGAKA